MSTALQPIPVLVPGADLSAYITTVSNIAPLTAEREQALATELHDNGSVEAARELVLAHLRFVVHIAKSYSGYGLAQADLIQEGNVGLMKAVKRFDPSRGVRLVSFAVHWIKAEMHEFILRNWRIVKIATTKAQRKLFFNLRSAKARLAWLSHDEAKAVAEDLGVSLKDVQQMEGRLTAGDMSFDPDPVDDDSTGSAPVYYLEDKSSDPAAALEDADWDTQARDNLLDALALLDARSQDILRSRWLSEPKATLHELADRYGVSAERVRQIEKQAMGKIRGELVA